MNTMAIILCAVVLAVLLSVVFRQRREIKRLEKDYESVKEKNALCEFAFYELEYRQDKVFEIQIVPNWPCFELICRMEKHPWKRCLIKSFPYNPRDEEDREFALREAVELKETIEKW